jgi:Ca2+-binding EF-hand superfamily protein
MELRKNRFFSKNIKTLTKEEINSCREFFNAIDKDGDGAIDYYDLKAILEEIGEMPK